MYGNLNDSVVDGPCGYTTKLSPRVIGRVRNASCEFREIEKLNGLWELLER